MSRRPYGCFTKRHEWPACRRSCSPDSATTLRITIEALLNSARRRTTFLRSPDASQRALRRSPAVMPPCRRQDRLWGMPSAHLRVLWQLHSCLDSIRRSSTANNSIRFHRSLDSPWTVSDGGASTVGRRPPVRHRRGALTHGGPRDGDTLPRLLSRSVNRHCSAYGALPSRAPESAVDRASFVAALRWAVVVFRRRQQHGFAPSRHCLCSFSGRSVCAPRLRAFWRGSAHRLRLSILGHHRDADFPDWR